VTFRDIYNLQRVRLVSKEDDVIPEGEAVDIRTQLRPRAAQSAGQSRQFPTLLTENLNEALSDGKAAAYSGNTNSRKESPINVGFQFRMKGAS